MVCGGLMMRSFVKLTRVDPGYRASNVLTFQVGVPGEQSSTRQLKAFADDLLARASRHGDQPPGRRGRAFGHEKRTRVSWQNPPCRRKGESSARGLSRRRRRADDATPTTATTTARLAWWSPGQQLIAAVELTGRRNPCSKTLRPERRRT